MTKDDLISRQPKRTEKRTKTHACDCISRSAAITAIQKAYADTEGGTDKCAVWKNVGLTNALHIMQDLPSAQPDIIRCKDCKHHSHDAGYGYDWCNRTSGVFRVKPEDFCSYAERREE